MLDAQIIGDVHLKIHDMAPMPRPSRVANRELARTYAVAVFSRALWISSGERDARAPPTLACCEYRYDSQTWRCSLDKNTQETFGGRVRAARTSRQITLRSFAKRVNVSPSHL